MKPISIHRTLIILIMLLAACAPITVHAAQATGEIDPVMLDALKSASFDLSSVGEDLAEVTLVDGAWEGEPYQSGTESQPSVRLYPDPEHTMAALGDLTGDGIDELVAALAIHTGDLDEFITLAVMSVGEGNSLTQLDTADLGDRTQIEQLAIEEGQALVEAVFVDEQDSVCYPGITDTLHLFFENDVLQIVSETDDAGLGVEPGEGEQIPYGDLVANAITQQGILTIHQVEDQWFLEIPQDMLGRPFYWYSELSKVPAAFASMGAGLDMIGEKMVEFKRIGNSIIVNELSSVTTKRSKPGEDASLDRAVAESALPSVLFNLPIVAESPTGALVVDFGLPLSSDLVDFSVGNVYQMLDARADFDYERSFIQDMDAYPNNIGISSLLTFLVTPSSMEDPYAMGMAAPEPATTQSVLVRHNITLLPEIPMTSRYADPRIGYFTVAYEDYSGAEAPDVVDRELITRFRLEKQDPNADLSEPVQPIVFYISREVPARWRSSIKQGVEDWLPAFEAAGFKNAIVVKDAPSVEEDPNWDPADTRHSVIRWVAQPIANAVGPSTVDPRSGEILSAHVQVFADVLELIEQWYFVQASAVDERARTLPLPDEILGAALRQVIAHEVGHALGLSHNYKASQLYTIDQLRDPEFTSQHGTSPSTMSYGRYNYIAQPGDGVTSLIPQLGPYDFFAIQWGYMPIADALSPEDERTTLDAWASRQIDEPWLRFGGEDYPALFDPTVLTENLGDDRIEATRLGIANLERVMGYLIDASTSLGSDYSKAQTSYDTLLEQRYNWLSSVVKLIGGVEETRTLAGRGGVQFHRVPQAEQQEALQFVLENLQTPPVFIPADVLDRLGPDGGQYGLPYDQKLLLGELMEPSRLERLVVGEQLNSADAYLLIDYLADLQVGIFSELKQEAPVIDPIRRDLQRTYVDTLQGFVDSDYSGDLRGAARWNLQKLQRDLDAAEANSGNTPTRAHLADLSDQIETILEGAGRGGDGE